jgi:predicted phosphodiesterase
MKLALIGDVHGRHIDYKILLRNLKEKGVEQTIALGDIGFGKSVYGEYETLTNGNMFLRGNHDPLDICVEMDECLCNYGAMYDNDLFYVAGAKTPENLRTLPPEYYTTEELMADELLDATDQYIETEPYIMISHTCPEEIAWDMMGPKFFGSTRTTQQLQTMFQAWQPKYWIFGHFHMKYQKLVNGCLFTCLEELKSFTLEL